MKTDPIKAEAMVTAIDNNNLSKLKILLKESNTKNPIILYYKRTALHHAAQKGHLDVFKLITSVVDDKNPKDAYGITPLHLASNCGHLNIVENLINFVPDVNIQAFNDNHKGTPLYYASQNGHLEIVKLLLKKGANPELKTTLNETPYDIAVIMEHHNVAKYLKSYKPTKCEHQCTNFPEDCPEKGK